MRLNSGTTFPWVWVAIGVAALLIILFGVFRRQKLALGAIASLPPLAIFVTGFVVSFWGPVQVGAGIYRVGPTHRIQYGISLDMLRGSFGVHLRHYRFIPPFGPVHPANEQRVGIQYYSGSWDPVWRWRPPRPIEPLTSEHTWVDFSGFKLYFWADPDDPAKSTVPFLGALILPGWLVLAGLSAAPIAWTIRRIRRRHPPGHCRKCGYDLRAHKAGQNCPECGTVVPAPAANSDPKAQTPPA